MPHPQLLDVFGEPGLHLIELNGLVEAGSLRVCNSQLSLPVLNIAPHCLTFISCLIPLTGHLNSPALIYLDLILPALVHVAHWLGL